MHMQNMNTLWTQATSKLQAAPPWAVLALASLIALLSGLGTNPVGTIELLALAIILLWAWASPWHGLLAAFPLLAAMLPAPQGIGAREAAFAAVLAAVFTQTLWRHAVSPSPSFRIPLRASLFAGGSITLLLTINFIVAYQSAVPLADWLRGLAPFLLLGMAAPIALLLAEKPQRVYALGAAAACLCLLYVLWILGVYITDDFYRPFRVLTTDPFFNRITAVIPQATDAILPLGVATGFTLWLYAPSLWLRGAALAFACLAQATVLVTYTRSMLLSVLLVVLGCAFWSLVHRQWRVLCRAIGGLFILALCTTAVLFVFSIAPIWLERLAVVIPASVPASVPCGDENTNIRLAEYRIAWSSFLDSPFMGVGLGAKHDIPVARTFCANATEKVAYIHNWPLYFLMVGGVPFFLGYSLALLLPALWLRRAPNAPPGTHAVIWSGLALLAIYALFFAVFRLLTFNLLLAAIWGVALSSRFLQQPGKP